MFVLPPPSNYSTQYAQQLKQREEHFARLAQAEAAPNTITYPAGEEDASFVAAEGQYTLRDEVTLAMPPPFATEGLPNALSTIPAPRTNGVRLSFVPLKHRDVPVDAYSSSPKLAKRNSNLLGLASPKTEEPSPSHLNRSLSSLDTESVEDDAADDDQSIPQSYTGVGDDSSNSFVSMFGTPAQRASGKQKKPKNSIAKTTSSFVSRFMAHTNLLNLLATRPNDQTLLFASACRSFSWLDYSSPNRHEALTRILFARSYPLCQDINMLTRDSDHLDVIVGFSSSDLIWLDPMTNKYVRLNKQGTINPSAVLEVKWIPGSENLFMAAHADGSVVVYDKEKDDSTFNPSPNASVVMDEGTEATGFSVLRSMNGKAVKTNPMAYWKVAKQAITAFAFSPDCQHIAITSDDGTLKIIDFHAERVLAVFQSYYGGLLCVTWSPDGRYILTGGQDDLITIWSFHDRKIVARCSGHNSFVKAVAFDPWRCDDRGYRFASVGDDCRMLFWDFSVGALHRPKPTTSLHRAASVSSRSVQNLQARTPENGDRSGALSPSSMAPVDQVVHPLAPRSTVAVLSPVLAKKVDTDPLSSITFMEDSIVTACTHGHVRTWMRPGWEKKANL
ncbi:hypothetical protein YB2330_000703 [Saitoella coloradoensis]